MRLRPGYSRMMDPAGPGGWSSVCRLIIMFPSELLSAVRLLLLLLLLFFVLERLGQFLRGNLLTSLEDQPLVGWGPNDGIS